MVLHSIEFLLSTLLLFTLFTSWVFIYLQSWEQNLKMMTQQGFKLWLVDQESVVLTFRSQRVQESEKHGFIPLINGITFNWIFVVYSITVYTVYLMSFYLFTKLRTESEGYLRLVEDWSYRVWNIHHSSSAAIHNKQETICCLWTLTSLFIYNLAQKVIPSSEDARDYTSFS